MAHLRDFATTAHRGLRGIEIPASPFNPLGLDDIFSFGFLLDLLPKKRLRIQPQHNQRYFARMGNKRKLPD